MKLIIDTDRKTYNNDIERTNAYQSILSTESGKIFLNDFLINMGFYNQQEITDINEVLVNIGKRNACNYLLNFVSITSIKKED
jgi:hypothetical protein